MKILKRILKAVAITFGVLLVLFVVLLTWGFGSQGPKKCHMGPLASIESCAIDHATFTFMNSGWWYTRAEGMLDPKHCAPIEGHGPLIWPTDKGSLPHTVIDCAEVFGNSDFARCLTHSRYSPNGNTKYFSLVAMDGNCQKGVYFIGSKRAMVAGEIVRRRMERPDPEQKDPLYPEIELPRVDGN